MIVTPRITITIDKGTMYSCESTDEAAEEIEGLLGAIEEATSDYYHLPPVASAEVVLDIEE